uniref:Uncharacterized protein n=1 Tax=Arundo donax TaxID=35708 RepID=A0A0A9FVK2_ARUDO
MKTLENGEVKEEYPWYDYFLYTVHCTVALTAILVLLITFLLHSNNLLIVFSHSSMHLEHQVP